MQKTFAQHCNFLVLCASLLLTGCGGGGSPGAVTQNTNVVTPAAVANVLNVQLGALDNYASPALPAYYDANVAAPDNTPAGNPVTDAGATLGRVLFYDKRVSINDTVSCASCHAQDKGFADAARFSTGFSGTAFTTAHSMCLGNARYFRPGSAFWDRRAASLEAQASQPVINSIEMGFDTSHGNIGAAIAKLQALSYYPALFQLAFGDSADTAFTADARFSNPFKP
jgi:cytochrome c peroxidase